MFAKPVNSRESRQRSQQCYYPVAKTIEASASFLSVHSRCQTEKINPLLRTRPQNTGIHNECEVR